MDWTDERLGHEYPVPIHLAAERAYEYISTRGHEAESGAVPWRALTPNQKQLWLQGLYEGFHVAVRSIAETLATRALRLTI